MFRLSGKVLSAMALLSALSISAVYGQQLTVKDGVFTQSQAETGRVVYDTHCGTCHDMKFYADIWEYWQDKPLLDFWFAIVAEMPAENPGSLLDSEYTDIVAYILSERGYPAGESILDRYNGLDNINIVAP